MWKSSRLWEVLDIECILQLWKPLKNWVIYKLSPMSIPHLWVLKMEHVSSPYTHTHLFLFFCHVWIQQQQGSCSYTKEPSQGSPSKPANDIIIERRWHGSSPWVRGEMKMGKRGRAAKVSREKGAAEEAETVRLGEERWRGRTEELQRGCALCCVGTRPGAALDCAWRNIDCWARTVTHMTHLMRASPYHSSLCGAATLSSVTMKCKAAMAKRANYKDGQSTYAPQSWQLDISIHHSEWIRGEGDEKKGGEEGGGKKNNKKKQMLFFLQSSCCILPTQLLRFTGCHSAVLLASVLDV